MTAINLFKGDEEMGKKLGLICGILLSFIAIAGIFSATVMAENLGQCNAKVWKNYKACVKDRDANNQRGDYCEKNRDSGLTWCEQNRPAS
ncbi:MAG: hypothetical protein KJ630_23165 [Proteobacteria bacterium]|nr:hypothetical protein [Pseudomonadota bacterium]